MLLKKMPNISQKYLKLTKLFEAILKQNKDYAQCTVQTHSLQFSSKFLRIFNKFLFSCFKPRIKLGQLIL